MILSSRYMNELVIGTFGLKNPPRPDQVPPIFYMFDVDNADPKEIEVYLRMMEVVVIPQLAEIMEEYREDETSEEKKYPFCTNCGKCE